MHNKAIVDNKLHTRLLHHMLQATNQGHHSTCHHLLTPSVCNLLPLYTATTSVWCHLVNMPEIHDYMLHHSAHEHTANGTHHRAYHGKMRRHPQNQKYI